MLETSTSGLMSGEGKRVGRLYGCSVPRPSSTLRTLHVACMHGAGGTFLVERDRPVACAFLSRYGNGSSRRGRTEADRLLKLIRFDQREPAAQHRVLLRD